MSDRTGAEPEVPASAAVSLRGKVVAITGAGSGIGLATAQAVSAAGASVVLAGRTATRLESAAAGLPGPCATVVLDVAAADSGRELVQATMSSFGSIDILVANAGIYLPGDFWDGVTADFDRLIATNVSGVLNTVHAAVVAMRAAGRGGDIVVTSSVSGHQAISWEPVYSASKHAVQAFVHSVRRQLVGSGIRLGAVAPGRVLNDLWQVTEQADIDEQVAAGLGIRSEDVAEAILFLLTRPAHVGIRDLVILPVNQEI